MREKFSSELKAAMKAGEKRRVDTIRMIMAALKDKDIEARGQGKAVSGDDILALLQKMVKSRKESLEIYEKAGRADLATQESEEIAIIHGFLPQQLTDAEVEQAIDAAIAETGAASIKDMGRWSPRSRENMRAAWILQGQRARQGERSAGGGRLTAFASEKSRVRPASMRNRFSSRRKIPGADVPDIGSRRLQHELAYVLVAPVVMEVRWAEAEHVGNHKHLPIGLASGADPDGGRRDRSVSRRPATSSGMSSRTSIAIPALSRAMASRERAASLPRPCAP